MNQEQYMKLLRKRLRRLPKEDFEMAVAYFEEYFTDAGPDQAEQAIADLGLPEEAAEQIIRDIAIRNTTAPVAGVRRSLGAVWVGILAVFAVPVALPLAIGLIVVAVMLMIAALASMLAVFLAGAAAVFAGMIAFLAGLSIITVNLPNTLVCLGFGLAGIGLGLLIIYWMCRFGRSFLNWTVHMFGRIVKRKESKVEEILD